MLPDPDTCDFEEVACGQADITGDPNKGDHWGDCSFWDERAWFWKGAEWAIAGMAVCEFLSDLAVLIELNNRNPYIHVREENGWMPGMHPNRSRR